MNKTLAVAAAGMATQQAVLDSIAANLANVDVPGYRVTRTDFSAFMNADGRVMAPESGDARRLFTQGHLDPTDNPHDLAIDGEGFFLGHHRDWPTRLYARRQLFAGRNGSPAPSEWSGSRRRSTSFRHGHLHGGRAGKSAGAGSRSPRGRGRGAHRPRDLCKQWRTASWPRWIILSNSRGWTRAQASLAAHRSGKIKQRCLERANVTVVAAMMAVLAAQRAYEANAKVVQAADEMLRLANNLERS